VRRGPVRPVLAAVVTAGLVVLMAAPASAASYVQVASSGAYGGISENGTHIVFTSSGKLVAADQNTLTDLYTLDQSTGAVRLVSANTAGQAVGTGAVTAASLGGTRMISDDGRYAVFTSSAAGVVSGVASGVQHAYRKDLSTDVVVLLDKSGSTPGAKSVNEVGGISAVGDKVAFITASGLVVGDTNGYTDAYLWQSSSGTSALITASATGSALGTINDVRLAASGGFAIYTRLATPPAVGWNLYRRNLSTGAVETLVSEVQLGEFAVSADGTTIAFQSNKSLVAGDAGGTDVYVRTSIGALKRVTVPLAGVTQPSTASHAIGNVSADGAYVSLSSNLKLASGAAGTTSGFTAYRVAISSGAAQVIVPSTSTPSTLKYTIAMSGSGTKLVVDSSSALWRVAL